MRIRDVMTSDVETCSAGTNLAEAAKMMWENDCGILPVVDDKRKLLGTITDRDIAIALGTREQLAKHILVSEVMPGGIVVTATPDEDIKSALRTMRSASVRRLPVMDKDGTLRGIVSINDIVLYARLGVAEPSYEDVVNTLKGICEHQTKRSAIA